MVYRKKKKMKYPWSKLKPTHKDHSKCASREDKNHVQVRFNPACWLPTVDMGRRGNVAAGANPFQFGLLLRRWQAWP